ncbi:MAG: tetratricopeptide repeat protein [Gemmatimonadota bacterium]
MVGPLLRTLHPVLCTLLFLGCPSAAADHSRLGDQALGTGDYATAVAEYRAGVQTSPRPELLAKLGSAALHLKSYREAADAYRKLGESDPARAGEAATGLERVAQAAQESEDAIAMRDALLGLQVLAPERPIGKIALTLALSGRMEPSEAISLLPYAMAGARDDATVDSLLTLYAAALRETTACEEAVGAYQTLARRNGDVAPANASQGLAECAVQLGADAQALNQPEIAERWYRDALAADSTSSTGRRALLGLGDMRLEQGDTVHAEAAYRMVISRGEADSLAAAASDKLAAMSITAGSDSTTNREP